MMNRHGEVSKGSAAASCAFMCRLDALTSAIYPFELEEEGVEGGDATRFSLNSQAALFPVLVGMYRLTVHTFRPYVMAGLFAMAGIGIARVYCAVAAAALLAYLCLFDDTFGEAVLGHAHLLPSGLHFHRSRRTEAIVSRVPALQHPHYTGTPWVIGGDMATIYPFLSFRLPLVEYTRRWLTVDGDDTQKRGGNHDFSGDKAVMPDKFDSSMHGTRNGEEMGVGKEAVALDVALPRAGLDPAKPFYIVLHGLNGGSAEAYVLDFTSRAVERGCGVCVMITRGCMDTVVRGENIFHGARISDVRSTVKALKQALADETPLAMVGYSMGGIIGANYAAISGDKSGLRSCVSMSGSFDTRTNMLSQHSLRLWQPMLALSLKENFVSMNTRKIAARGVDLAKVEACKTVLDFDIHLVAPYNGYPSVTDYYVDMSAAAEGKIAGLRTPLLAVSALDDPIMTAAGSPIEELEKVKDLFILLTRKGGHVGWPTGWLPTRNRWKWMSSTALDFSEAVVATSSISGET